MGVESPGAAVPEPGGIVVRAVCAVHQLVRTPGRLGVTAIDKRPVDGPVPVHGYGLRGDVQADAKHHGGPFQAVYLLSDEDVAPWAEEFGGSVPPGWFGENLRLAGVETTDLVIGSRLRVGERVEVELTSPRVPCRTFADWTKRPAWVRRFTECGRTGVYTRVLRTGSVRAGDGVEVLSVPGHGVTVGEAFAGPAPERSAALLAAYRGKEMHADLRSRLEKWAAGA